MTKDQISTYTMRISQANTSELAVILYELIIDHIKKAISVYEAFPAQETEASLKEEKHGSDLTEYERALTQAQNFLHELMSMSKLNSETGADVMALYLFINKQLLLSVVKRQPVNLTECLSYLERLKASFEELAKKDTDAPLMEHTQQVYAGLTYGRGYLTESLDPMGNSSRGFKA